MKKTFLLLVFSLFVYVFGAQAVSVTVSIDMSSYTGPSFTSVMTNGGFKGWGNAVVLSTDKDSIIWTATVTMNAGTNDYRFEVGGGKVGWNAEWEGKTSTGDCFVNPEGKASNMRWIIINGDAILPTVSWESCELKTAVTNNSIEDFNNINIVPNPVTDYLLINNLKSKADVTLLNLSGQQILEQNILENEKVDIHNIPVGMYFVKVKTSNEKCTFKIVKR